MANLCCKPMPEKKKLINLKITKQNTKIMLLAYNNMLQQYNNTLQSNVTAIHYSNMLLQNATAIRYRKTLQ